MSTKFISLAVPHFHSSVYKSVKYFGRRFAFDAPKIWIGLANNIHNATSIAYLKKSSKFRVSNLKFGRNLKFATSITLVNSMKENDALS